MKWDIMNESGEKGCLKLHKALLSNLCTPCQQFLDDFKQSVSLEPLR